MPESNEMMSVEGQLVGMPLAGPESFSLEQLNYLKRALGVDETVLFSGSSVAANLILSEAPSNFEYIRVEFRRSSSLLGFVSSVTLPVNSTSVSFPLMLVYGNVDNSTNYNEYIVRYNGNTTQTTFTFQYALKRISVVGGDVTIATDTAPTLEVFKVVGIGRIAGGN